MGNEGFIGEDGAIEKSENDDDEEDDDDNDNSKDGMRTRQSRKYRKKTSTDKNEVISRTRQGTQNRTDDNSKTGQKKVDPTRANSSTKKTSKPVASKAATKSIKTN